MPLSWLTPPGARWRAVSRRGYRPLQGGDLIFALLRLAALLGIAGWFFFSPRMPQLTNLLAVFTAYSLLFYLAFFFVALPVALLYMVVHVADALFVAFLVAKTGGMASDFFVAFYILAAFNGLYFGWRSGVVTAPALCVVYYFTDPAPLVSIHWTDFLIRCAPMFLLGWTMGFLSEQIDRDRRRIELLNTTFQDTLARLKEAQLQLLEQERLTALGQAAADIAHEIRNPLVAIGGFARRLKERSDDDPSSARYSGIIVDETARLERILNDVLLFTREKELKQEPVSLNVLAENVISISESVLSARKIAVVRRFDPALPDVLGDHDRLQQVLINLTTNAEQATPDEGTITVTTFTATRRDQPWACISISDTGPGIEPSIQHRIFDPFFSTKPIGEGTGLGLSICKKIVEEHGGSIEVKSNFGDGATLTVLLPAVEESEPAHAEAEGTPKESFSGG